MFKLFVYKYKFLCFCKCHFYSDEYQVIFLGVLLGGALSDMCRHWELTKCELFTGPNTALQILVFKHSIKQLQHFLEHDADDDGMIREDKGLFPEVYDEGC